MQPDRLSGEKQRSRLSSGHILLALIPFVLLIAAVVLLHNSPSDQIEASVPPREAELPAAALPALRVSLDDEQAEPASVHAPVILQRTATLVVECCAQADDDSLDDTCDQMAKEVETALAAGFTVAGRHLDALFSGSRFDDEAAGLDAGVKRLEFRIEFFTPANAPDTLT